jgi:hypothetical protein
MKILSNNHSKYVKQQQVKLPLPAGREGLKVRNLRRKISRHSTNVLKRYD